MPLFSMPAMASLSEFQLSAAERLEPTGSFQNGAAAQLMAGCGPIADQQVMPGKGPKAKIGFGYSQPKPIRKSW